MDLSRTLGQEKIRPHCSQIKGVVLRHSQEKDAHLIDHKNIEEIKEKGQTYDWLIIT